MTKIIKRNLLSTTTIYRCEDINSSTLEPSLFEYPVIRETKFCYIIKQGAGEKFILKSEGGKRFAYASKDNAVLSYCKRKRRRLEILSGQIGKAKHNFATANRYLKEVMSNDVLKLRYREARLDDYDDYYDNENKIETVGNDE